MLFFGFSCSLSYQLCRNPTIKQPASHKTVTKNDMILSMQLSEVSLTERNVGEASPRMTILSMQLSEASLTERNVGEASPRMIYCQCS